MNDLTVIPCSAADALAWAQGKIHDDDIQPAEKPEAVFFRRLPSRSAYRRGLQTVKQYAAQGAVCFVGRTKIESVARYLRKRGAVATVKETAGDVTAMRYIIPPKEFAAWMEKLRLR